MDNTTASDKEPFEIDRAMEAVRGAVETYPPASLFQLADEGYGSLFEVLIGCILSIRTRDEDMLAPTRRLFARARTPAEVADLPRPELLSLIAVSYTHLTLPTKRFCYRFAVSGRSVPTLRLASPAAQTPPPLSRWIFMFIV